MRVTRNVSDGLVRVLGVAMAVAIACTTETAAGQQGEGGGAGGPGRAQTPPGTPSAGAPAPAPSGPAPGPARPAPPPAPAAFSAEAAEPYFAKGPTATAAAAFAIRSWQVARDGFAAHLPKTTDRAMRARLSYLVALCDARLGRHAAAAPVFDATVDALPLLADHARYQAARAWYFAHDMEKALDRAARVGRDSVLDAERRLLEGDIFRAQGRWADVARTYEEYLAAYPRGMRRAEARFRLAEAYEHLGRGVPDALRLYREITIDAVLSSWGEQAEARVKALLEEVPRKDRAAYRDLTAAEHMARGQVLFDAMRNPESEAAYVAALGAPGLDRALECQARYGRAQSVFKQRQRARSAPLFDEAAAACVKAKNVDLEVRSLYQAGRGYGAASNAAADPKAIDRFARCEASHPEHSFADDARMRQAEIWVRLEERGEQGAAEKVTELLSTIPTRYPQGDMRGEALWRLAWRAYRAGDYAAAIGWLDKEIAAVPHDDNYWAEGQPQYWKGRAHGRLGQEAESLAAYEACVQKYPLGYYSLLALNRLRERAPERYAKLVAELKRPPASWKPGTPALAFKARPVFGEPGFARAVELLRLGLGEEAERELARVGLGFPAGRAKVSDPDRVELLWAAALLHDRAGVFNQSHWTTRWHIVDYRRTWPTEANRLLWEIAYPRAWWHLLEPAAAAQGYPPELLISFVREESAFDPVQESFANAIGLTQMIFPTAERFGAGLGFPITRENLRDPEKNVQIGSRFLAYLVKLFEGRFGLVVPAYNSGEGSVWKFLCERGTWAQDEFAEQIPYDETRNYSKRVLATFFTYSYLRDGTVPLLPNDIPPSVIRTKRCAGRTAQAAPPDPSPKPDVEPGEAGATPKPAAKPRRKPKPPRRAR